LKEKFTRSWKALRRIKGMENLEKSLKTDTEPERPILYLPTPEGWKAELT